MPFGVKKKDVQANAASFSWDQVDRKRKEGEPYKASGPQSGLHPYDVDGWPEMERRKAMFEAALAKIPKPPEEKCRWGTRAGQQGPEEFAHLSLAIVEPRQHEWMRPVLWNACHVWGGSGAGLIIFHGNLNKEWLECILEESGMSGVLLKPLGVDNLTREMYSGMFCEAQFYDNFPTTHVLVFQTDVVMRRRIPAKFFDFAYVGSPFTLNSYLVSRGGNVAEVPFGFDGGLKCIGNGGYSLRNVEEMKRLFAANNWLEWNRKTVRDLFGGQWGESDGERPAGEAKDRPKQVHPRDVVVHEDIFIGSLTDSARLPFNHEATEFGVESIWHPDPTGMHRPFFPSYRAPAAFLKAGEWQNPPWSEICPERPLWEDRFISTDMFESLLECVADPCVASDAHKHSAQQPTDMMLPEKAWEQMQNAPHPVPYRVEKRDILLGAGALPQCNLLMPLVSGLKWEEIGGKAPERGSELHNVELTSALQLKQEFSIEEVNKFGFLSVKQELPYDCFVNVNGKYFKPAADWWQRVSSE